MITQFNTNLLEQTNFQTFDLIYEGMNKKGIYLLEYHDTYLKDAFVTQLAEQFLNQGSNALFIQEETTKYSLRDIFLCRTHFKHNPHSSPSLSKISQKSDALLNRHFMDKLTDLEQRTTIISVNSKHPTDYLHLLFDSMKENPQKQIVIIDSHTDYFYRLNLIPQLAKMSFDSNVTILFTSQVTTEKFTEKSIFLPSFIKNSLYLHSRHTDLYSQSNSKEVAYQFELDIRTPSNQRLINYFTIRPASAYCQEG